MGQRQESTRHPKEDGWDEESNNDDEDGGFKEMGDAERNRKVTHPTVDGH